MFEIVYTEQALQDLENIRDYIAKDNPWYAQKVLDDVTNFISVRVSLYPQIGRSMSSGVRRVIEPNFKYNIVYRCKGEQIVVYSVFKYKNVVM